MGDDGDELTLRLMGAPTVPFPMTRAEWSSYTSGVIGGAEDAGNIGFDIEDSGVSGVSGVRARTTRKYGGAPAWTDTGGRMGFGGELNSGRCDLDTKTRVGAGTPEEA